MSNTYDANMVSQAKSELEEEERRHKIDQLKIKLREETWWSKLLPFKIIVTWRKDHG